MQRRTLVSLLIAAAFPVAAAAMPAPFIGPASDALKQAEVQSAAVYPQEGAISGRQAVLDRAQAYLPPPLATDREKQQVVAAVTEANAGA